MRKGKERRGLNDPAHPANTAWLLRLIALLKDVLEHALPATCQDVVLVFVTVSGYRNGQFLQESYANKIYGTELNGTARSAIQLTTAAGICAMLDLLATGVLPQKGFVRQEQVSLATFLSNRFGSAYGTRGPQPASRAA